MSACPHWSRVRDRGQGVCAIGRCGGKPWPGECVICLQNGENVVQPPGTWPLLTLPLKALAKPGDKGLGDIVARVVGPIGGTAFKLWFERTLGRSCGCEARQAALNARYPL